jgi:putative Mg2+ transporter-C (MgtC) family protein
MFQFFQGYELYFLIDVILAVIAGYLIGVERELRGKPAGISTHILVISGAAMFSFISSVVDPASKTRVAAQIVTGVGFLGAGMILKGENGAVTNLTTAASVWLAAGIGMALGFNLYFLALIGTLVALIVPRIPHVKRMKPKNGNSKKNEPETSFPDDSSD